MPPTVTRPINIEGEAYVRERHRGGRMRTSFSMGTFRQGKSLWTPLLKAPIKFKASPRQGGAAEAEE
jgi:hypothetical protein